ncbi:MAG: DUF3108 domain-containing protein [Flavobacteriales bacterium]
MTVFLIGLVKKPFLQGAGKAFFVFMLSLGNLPSLFGQKELGTGQELAFKVGEKLHYQVKYEWGGIWTQVGKATFSVKADTSRNGTSCFAFEANGRTLAFYDNFFKVRDLYRSYASRKGLHSLRFIRKVREGDQHYAEEYLFDRGAAMFYRLSTGTEKVDSISYPLHAMDVLTAIYYCRSLNLQKLHKGDTVPIDLVLGKKVHDTHFTYRGKTSYKGSNGKEYRCHFIEPKLIPGSLFEAGDRMKVLVTDDRRKVPVYVNTDIIVGNIKVSLLEMEGTIDP